MSLVLNMIGGGGSFTATDAILRVQAPAGSIVTISKGGTTKSDFGHENVLNPTYYDYYFIIHQSQFDSLTPWTVTATLSDESASDTIIIDVSDEYNVLLEYIYYLYKEGEEYISKTGGWEVKWEKSKRASKEATYLNLTSAESNGQAIATINKVDLTNFSNFCMEMPVASTGNTKFHNMIVWTDNSSATSAGYVANWEFGNIAAGVYRLSIASVSGPRKLGFRSWNGANFRVSKVWLE